MNPLPLIERELRVGARRPSSYRVRFFAALSVFVVWLLMLLSDHRASPAERSFHLFVAFSVLALGFCLLAGIFLTADCLSEEKREGTLGLLFLTNLKGYDVVLGKLSATSLHSFYGLLAIFPILGLPLLMGGVTVGEFWRVVLVLVVTLFLSLTLGLFVSALSREARQAMGGTLLGIIVLAGILPALWWLHFVLFKTRTMGNLLLPSPTNALRSAFDFCYSTRSGPHEFWTSISLVAALALGFLGLAALILPRVWQEKKQGRAARPERLPAAPTLALAKRRAARHLMEQNPYLWLASRAQKSRRGAWVILAALCALWGCFLFAALKGSGNIPAFIACLFTAYGLHQLFKSMVAAEATRQLSADRQSGALELLLVTPLTEHQIIEGQKEALRGRFVGWGGVLFAVNACLCFAVLIFGKEIQIGERDVVIFLELFLGGILMLFLDFSTLGTVGIWMALGSKRPSRAILATIGRVLFLPWAAIFLMVFLMQAIRISGPEGPGLIFALWFGFGILNNALAAATAKASLARGFRRCLGLSKFSFIEPVRLGSRGASPEMLKAREWKTS